MSAPDEADRFLTLLAEANASIEWVVTVRSDFIDRILINPRLGGLLEEVLLLVPPLLDHEVSSAVTGPARRVGVEVEANLVAEVIRDVRARPSALPLLQYALTDTFERRRGPTLALADYQDAGGISGALSRRADELYETMDPSRKEAARQLLLALVAVTEDGEEVRRRVDREALMSLPAGGAQISWVIERLGTERLLTFDQSPETGRATVEVAHEALISEWPRLARWVENSRDDLRLRQRISAAAQEWVESGRDSGFLLTGSRLDQFSGWASATDLELTALESDYLRSSRQASQDRQRRASRTRTLIVAGVAVGVVAATGLGVLALSQRQATEEQTRIVQAANLAAAANDSLEIDPERSILLAVEAVETTRRVDGTVLGVAEEALHRAVLAHRLLGRVTHNGTGIAHFSPDGRTFVTSAEDATTAQVWSVTPFEPALTLTGHTDLVIDAVFDPAGDRIATGSLDGSVRVWNATNGELQITFEVGGAPPLIPVFSNDGSMLAATSLDGTTRVWDLDTQDLVWALSPPPGTINTLNLEFSPDDTLLAVTRSTEPAAEQIGPLIYDLTTGELVRTLEGHLSGATDIGFTPDGTRIVTSAHDLTLRVWEVETGEHTGTYFGHVGPVQDLQISADGSTVASSGRVDVQVWDLETFETKATIVGHGGLVDGIDLSPGGDLLLTASDTDKTARLWDLTTYWSHELVGLPGPTKDLLAGTAYSPDGEILAASRGTGQVTLWNPITGREIESFEGPGIHQNLAFDPTGSILAAAGSAGVTLHDIQSHEDIASLVEGVFTNDVAFSSQGLLAAATLTGVHLLEPPYTGDGEVISTLQTNSVAFDPRGEIIALSLQDGFFRYFIEIRAVDGGELLAELTEHDQGVYGLAFDPAGEVLATASDDTTVILWDTNTFEPIHRLEGHTAELFDVAFDPTRPEIATASGDGTIKIWDLHTGKLRLTLPGSGSEVAYSPDGRYLAAAGPEGFVTVYMLDIDELIAEAQSRLTRWWTDGECFQYLRTDECPPTGE